MATVRRLLRERRQRTYLGGRCRVRERRSKAGTETEGRRREKAQRTDAIIPRDPSHAVH